MEDEKMLPLGEPTLRYEAPASPTATRDEPAVPGMPGIKSDLIPGMPTRAQQQWGVVISIVIIVLMVIIGAFYAWGERIAQNQVFTTPETAE